MIEHAILLVEDNPADAALAQEAFVEAGIPTAMTVARDGDEALRMLRGNGAAPIPTPDLILLDLKLGRLHGHDVLAELKADAQLRLIPVVVLTTSVADNDVQQAYALHANSYMRKPVSFDELVRLARGIGEYWFDLVRLPRQ